MRRPRVLASKVRARVGRVLQRKRPGAASDARKTIWLYRPEVGDAPPLPALIPGMHMSDDWEEIVAAVTHEQGGRGALNVVVYRCAPLQWIRRE